MKLFKIKDSLGQHQGLVQAETVAQAKMKFDATYKRFWKFDKIVEGLCAEIIEVQFDKTGVAIPADDWDARKDA